MQDLGVKIVRNRSLSKKDLTVEKVLKDGAKAVFIGIGLPQPKPFKVFEGLKAEMGFYTSKDFLPKVSSASKPGKFICNTHRIIISEYFFELE